MLKKTFNIIIILSLLLIIAFSCTMPVRSGKIKTDGGNDFSITGPLKAENSDEYYKEYGPFECFWIMTDEAYATTDLDNDQNKILIADMQSINGGDTCALRFDNTNSKIRVKLEEEKSYDTEIGHVDEIIAGLLVDKGVIDDVSGNHIGYAFNTSITQTSRDQEHTVYIQWPGLGDPVAFAQIRTNNNEINDDDDDDFDPAHVRIIECKRATNTLCKITFNLEEWNYQDGVHTEERIDFVVLQKGIYKMGILPRAGDPYFLEVGEFKPGDKKLEDKKVKLMTHFDTKPLIITQTQTFRGWHENVTINKGINTNDDSFMVRLFEEQKRWKNDDRSHNEEDIGYLALGKGEHTFTDRSNVVDNNGNLRVLRKTVNGKSADTLCNQSGSKLQLKGMSSFWLNWEEGNKFANSNAIEWLISDWEIEVYRVAVGVSPIDPDMSGELIQPLTGIVKEAFDLNCPVEDTPSFQRACDLIDICIRQGIYVIVDWHVHDNYYGYNYEFALSFFEEMSKRYGGYPNVIFEVWNEPGTVGHIKDNPMYVWQSGSSSINDIKSYCEEVVEVIRDNDPDNNDNIIICPTPCWDQWVTYIYDNIDGINNTPLNENNILYTYHFYAGSHTPPGYTASELGLPNGSDVGGLEHQPNVGPGNAFNAGWDEIPLFVTEWGTSLYDGGQADTSLDAYIASSEAWIDILAERNVSWCNWSISDKNEGASALLPGANVYGHWSKWALSESGEFIREKIKE